MEGVVIRDLRFGRACWACCTPWENATAASAPPCQSADRPRATTRASRASQKGGSRCHLSHPHSNVFLCLTAHRCPSKTAASEGGQLGRQTVTGEHRLQLKPTARLAGWRPCITSHLTLGGCVFCGLYSVFCASYYYSHTRNCVVFCTLPAKGPENIPRHPWESGTRGPVATAPAGMEQSPESQPGRKQRQAKGRACEAWRPRV